MPAFSSNILMLLNDVVKTVTQEKDKVYLVGGFVRDLLLERETNDIDISINDDAVELAKKISGITGGRYVLLDDINRVARVVMTKWEQPLYIDLSTFSGTIEQDLARRDFTIDAMAVEMGEFLSGTWHVIDPFGGKADLKAKTIRAVNHGIFRDDPVRLLRAFRLAAELDGNIAVETRHLIKQYAKLITSVSGERQRDELLKIFALSSCSDYLRYLDEVNLLTEIIPEMEELRYVEQPKEHYWDVLNHSFETVAVVEFILRERQWKYNRDDLLKVTPWTKGLEQYFDEKVSSYSNRRISLKIGALLHDVAKPQTKTVDKTGRIRFIGHAREGATKAVNILTRLRFSSREIKLVENLVCYHLRPVQMANAGLPTSRAIYRYFRDVGDVGVDILFLALADYLAARGPNLNVAEWEQHNHLVSYIMMENQKQQQKRLPVKLVDGHDIMENFCLTSGPLIGKLLRLVYEAQAVGEIETKDEAINLVGRILDKEGHNKGCVKLS